MIHVFNSPVECSTMSEFQKSKDSNDLFDGNNLNKRKITYYKDGRKMVDGKIEVEQNPTDLWTSALTRSVANEFKGLSNLKLFSVAYLNNAYRMQPKKFYIYILLAINALLLLIAFCCKIFC
ncbi:unnamed protein product [Dracunculus medinensis]|uniref:Uncharacterized protein n=1 Tax=Dracunculus medinensis TaxID=318479 RepID=A0A0N4UM10_DRAME|nr:unnamed protein product [Dracunculus medinensis]